MNTHQNIINTFKSFLMLKSNYKGLILFICLILLLFAKKSFGQTFQVNGNAVNGAAGSGLVKLTANGATNQVSSAWCTTKIDLTQPFDKSFDLFFGCESGPNGGDGMTFTFQNQSINALGGGGGNLGLNGISPAVSIEFDTYDGTGFGGANEIPADHIALDLNGVVNGSTSFIGTSGATTVQAISAGRDLEDCASMANDYLTIRIVWDPIAKTLQLYEDGVLTLTYTDDIVNTIFGGNPLVYWGFSGATGTASNEQWIAPAGSIIPWTCSVATTCCTPFTVTPTGPTTLCSAPISIGVSGVYTSYSWSNGQTTAAANITTPGTYTVNVIQTQAGVKCPGSATVVISPVGPTANISGGGTICADGTTTPLSVSLTGTGPWSITYAIDGVVQPAVTGINSSPYSFPGTATHVYTLNSVSDNSACNGVVSGSATVNGFNGSPVTHDNTFNAPGTTLLTVDNGGGSYDWYTNASGGVPFLTNSLSYTTPTLSATTTYYVQNSALTATYNKSVALLNVAAGNGPAPNDIATGLPPAVDYLDFTANSNFTLSSITAEILASGAGLGTITINITPYASAPPYTGAETVAATLVNTPIASAGYKMINVPFTYACTAGTTYHISYSASGVASTTMHWQLVAASSFPITTNSELTIKQYGIPNTRYPGLFDWQISVGDPAFACARTPVTAIAILPTCKPPASITLSLLPAPTTVCKGSNVTIKAAIDSVGKVKLNGNYFFSWYKGATLVAGPSVVYSDLALSNLTLADAAVYKLVVEDGNIGDAACSTSGAITIAVNDSVSEGTIATSQVICSGGSALAFTSTLPATGGSGASPTYKWVSSPDGVSNWTTIGGATSATYNAGTVATTTYYKRVAAIGTACPQDSSNALSITVTPVVTASVIGSDQTICTNTIPATLTEITAPSGGTGTYTYQWQTSANGTSGWTNATGVSTNATYSPAALSMKTYYRCVISSGTCSSKNSNVIAISIQGLVVPSITIDPVAKICVGTTVNFTTTHTGQGTTPSYAWTVNGTPVGSSIDTYSSSTLANGDQVAVVMTSSLTCASPTTATSPTITMQVKPIPTPQIVGNDTTICSGQKVKYTSLTGTGTLTWQKNGNPISGANGSSYNSTSSGDYTIKENNGTCSGTSAPVTVTVTPGPTANAGPDQYVKEGATVTLKATGGTSYIWTPASGLSDATIANPTLTAKATETYTVKVYDATHTCFSFDEVTIYVESEIEIPNVITPNGDNNNDSWEIKNIQGSPECTVEVFNRWGTLVWKSTGYAKQWDGTNFRNGELLPDGTYFYVIDLKSQTATTGKYSGYIQVIK